MSARGDAAGDDRDPGAYAIRPFAAGDRGAFLDLFETVFDERHGDRWFAWKYADNPYADHVPVFVAERDGEVVGARSFLALPMAVEGRTHRALQPCDTMVHPDHRGLGLLTRMTEAALARYTDGEFAFCFNFPNAITLSHNLDHGWETVAELPTYYRVHDPVAMAGAAVDSSWAALAGRVAGPAAGAYYRARDRLARPPTGVTVDRHDAVPGATLAALHAGGPDAGIRADRDERFYDWRFDNPDWRYRAYVARTAGDPVAAVVVATAADDGVTTAKVVDVVPTPDASTATAFAALCHRVARDHRDAAVLAAPPVLPDRALSAAGFRSDARPPLSAVSERTTHVARTLTGDWTVEGVDIRDADNWQMAFVERDAS